MSEGHSSAEGSNARILKFDKSGKFIKSFGKLGKGPGEFDQPHALAMDSKGRLFVGDRSNNRIQIFDQDGKFIAEWTQFSRPSGIAIDATTTSMSPTRNPDRSTRRTARGRAASASAAPGTASVHPDLEYCPDQRPTRARGHNTSAAEGVAVDRAGNIYGAEVGPRALKKYVKEKVGDLTPDEAWSSDRGARRATQESTRPPGTPPG